MIRIFTDQITTNTPFGLYFLQKAAILTLSSGIREPLTTDLNRSCRRERVHAGDVVPESSASGIKAKGPAEAGLV